jgi:hypothetical protein
VLLHFDEHGNPHVGYIANMHTQAFQGSEVILLSQLTDIFIFVSLFKEKNALSKEIIDFDIICGDFNADNMSPGKMLSSVQLSPIIFYEKHGILNGFFPAALPVWNWIFHSCFITIGCNVDNVCLFHKPVISP